MLKSGLVLFFVPTTVILLRALEFETLADTMITLLCTASLLGAICCFLGTYRAATFNKARVPIQQP